MIGMEGNRLRQARDPRVQRTTKAMLKALEAQLAELEREIGDAVKGSPVWRAADDLLTSVPGVGDITARTLIADLPGTRTARSAAHRSPCRRCPGQSGFRADARQPHHRRRPGRRSERPLHGDPVRDPRKPGHQQHHKSLVERGRPKKVALVACMRRLLGILNAIIRTKTPWQDA